MLDKRIEKVNNSAELKIMATMTDHGTMEMKNTDNPVENDAISDKFDIDAENTANGIDYVREKKLLRKVDLNLITLFGVCFPSNKCGLRLTMERRRCT